MKRRIKAVLMLAACLVLGGCAAAPEQAADGAPWQEEWVTVGGVLGVDTPDGMDFQENNDTLAADGMYYATWTAGEGIPYTTAEGEETHLYDAQIFLLLASHPTEYAAQADVEEWLSLVDEHYQTDSAKEQRYNGEDFQVFTYTFLSETNPYPKGASAFGRYGNNAISVEISCGEDFQEGALACLERFLENCHYGA